MRRNGLHGTKSTDLFQFTHPGGVRHHIIPTDTFSFLFQFTHPGGVRHPRFARGVTIIKVSIHAPGRGATFAIIVALVTSLFQFTHPGGVRLISIASRGLMFLFQFTHPGGVRPTYTKQARHRGRVSIHAPGRGATKIVNAISFALWFQFTHPGGVRLPSWLTAGTPQPRFNSRTREGCDRLSVWSRASVACFNSRTREGCDLDRRGAIVHTSNVSIHAPGRGATQRRHR